MKIIIGKAHPLGDQIDTDQIYPGRYIDITQPEEIALHCLEGVDPTLQRQIRPGDLIVAGQNFGCGSSREHAVITLIQSKVGAVVAESFARIFFRNAINLGLPVVVCPGVSQKVSKGDELTLDVAEGVMTNQTTGKKMQCEKLPPYIMDILSHGGIKPLFRKRMNQGP